MKFSASMLKTWMTCPLQARFKEIDKRPSLQNAKASFGTCVHDALEYYNSTGDVDQAIERFKYTWYYPESLGVEPDYWPKRTTYEGLRSNGIDALKQYADKTDWSSRAIVVQEHRFCVPIGDHKLTGIVDLIEATGPKNRKPTRLRIIDYKTNSRNPTYDELELDIQFTIYAYASMQPEFWLGSDEGPKYTPIPNGDELYEYLLDVPREPVWYAIMKNKELKIKEKDERDFERLYRLLEQVADAIEKEVFVPNISGSSCNFCDYKDDCEVVIPVKGKVYGV